jgi:enamine deaminase RidA (YjgF/YER057c/UK114 family)
VSPGEDAGAGEDAGPREVRRLISSGGPWEASAGYSRAVVVGDSCWVSGTTDAGPDGRSLHPGDPRAQAEAALDVIERALAEAGFSTADVVRTRTYVTSLASIPAVLAAHGTRFAVARPSASVVVVSGLIDPSLLVEIEADARRA